MPTAGAERTDELELLRAAAAGQPAAVRRLLDEVAPVVYGYLYARVGGEQAVAEDLLQETLLEAVKSARSFRGDAALSTWLCAIARRRLARHYDAERKAEAARRGLYALADPSGVEADGFDGLDRRDEIIRALGRLSPLHRQVLVLKYLDGLPAEQVASRLGRTAVQVQSLLQRARQGLRHELGADDG